MDTFETDIFNRTKLMQITAGLMTLLFMGLLALMLLYCKKKVIIVSDYEENIVSNEKTETARDFVWKINTLEGVEKELHIPLHTSLYSCDMDYINNVFRVKLPDENSKFYIDNMPYGDYSKVKDATGSFDGEYVTYTFALDSCLEAECKLLSDELLVSFAPINHEKTIVLVDPGHGGNAVGNMAGGLMEKDIALNIADKIQKMAQDKDYKVILTRGGDRKVGTGECISIANLTKADYYIAIHVDADVEDTKTFGLRASYNPDFYRAGFENVDFADSLLSSVALSTSNKAIGLSKAGEDELVLKVLKIPAAILYMGYVSNSSEAELLSNDQYLEKIAQGVIESLDNNIK